MAEVVGKRFKAKATVDSNATSVAEAAPTVVTLSVNSAAAHKLDRQAQEDLVAQVRPRSLPPLHIKC